MQIPSCIHSTTFCQALFNFAFVLLKQFIPALVLGIDFRVLCMNIGIYSAFIFARVIITAVLDHYTVNEDNDKEGYEVFPNWFTWPFIYVMEVLAGITSGLILFRRHPRHA